MEYVARHSPSYLGPQYGVLRLGGKEEAQTGVGRSAFSPDWRCRKTRLVWSFSILFFTFFLVCKELTYLGTGVQVSDVEEYVAVAYSGDTTIEGILQYQEFLRAKGDLELWISSKGNGNRNLIFYKLKQC